MGRACACLLLLVGCGDDSVAPPDAPAPQPDAPSMEWGEVVLRHLGLADAGVPDDGGFFDFNNDGTPDNSLATLSILNSTIQSAIDTSPGGLRVLGRLDNYDSATDDPSLSVALFHAFDG